jgi:4-hydroxy-tetrahydrodipicolinate synthase
MHVRECLTGPFPSIRTPFLENGSIDYEGLKGLIDFSLEAKSKALMLTAGDSHYICLSDEEIAEVTRVACRRAAGKALVIAADRYHSTERAIEFARFARETGANLLMCLPPDWAGSCTEETLADHYAAVARVMPVMMVTGLFLSRGAEFGLRTIELTLNRSENVVAIKDDFCGDFARKLCLLASGRVAVTAGGQKQNHMNMWPYGCDGYLSTFMTFKPEIARRYWAAIEAKDVHAARRVISEYDVPLFDFIQSLRGGFDAGLHGLLEIYGLAKRWRRKPYYSLNDAEMEKLRGFVRAKDLL